MADHTTPAMRQESVHDSISRLRYATGEVSRNALREFSTPALVLNRMDRDNGLCTEHINHSVQSLLLVTQKSLETLERLCAIRGLLKT